MSLTKESVEGLAPAAGADADLWNEDLAPTTAASATAGWSTRADSTSVVEIR